MYYVPHRSAGPVGVGGGVGVSVGVTDSSTHDIFGTSRWSLPGYIIGTSLRADKVLVTLTSFSRSQENLDDKLLYQRYLLNQLMEFHQTFLDNEKSNEPLS